MTPGRKLSSSTSAVRASRRKTAFPASAFRSIETLFLFRLSRRKYAPTSDSPQKGGVRRA